MSDLVQFLRARLDEDEAECRDHLDNVDPEAVEATFYGDLNENWIHWATVRMLREVEAKRRIVERAHRAFKVAEAFTPERLHRDAASPLGAFHSRDTYEGVLIDLARVYSDHPDYCDEWKP